MENLSAAEYVPTSLLLPWDENPRDNDEAVAAVADAIARFGFGAPIVAWPAPDGARIIAGHTRRLAAIKLGLAQVPVRMMPHLSEGEAKLLALADNKLGEIAAWSEGLPELLSRLRDEELDLSGLGWGDEELEDLIGEIDLPAPVEDQGIDPNAPGVLAGYVPRPLVVRKEDAAELDRWFLDVVGFPGSDEDHRDSLARGEALLRWVRSA